MRISDWSSDVCSSDLLVHQGDVEGGVGQRQLIEVALAHLPVPDAGPLQIGAGDGKHLTRQVDADQAIGTVRDDREHEIGRASCRERVCQYVSIPVVAVSLKKKKKKHNKDKQNK